MKIILLGYMGSGKSTVGKKLAELLNFKFMDLDAYIEERESLSIPDIFESKGEIYFRKKEHAYLKEVLAASERVVLATGGGTPCYGNNLATMLETSKNVFYLRVSLNGLLARLKTEKEQRPLIKDVPDSELLEFMGKHLFERSFFYNQASKVISCDAKTPEAIAAEIRALLV